MINTFLIFTVLAITAYFDYKNKEISNLVPISIIILGIFANINNEMLWSQVLQGAFIFAVLFIAICTAEVITNKTIMGGGDIKLIGVLAFYLSYGDFALMIFYTALVSLIFLIIYKYILKKTISNIAFAPFLFGGYAIQNIYKLLQLLNGGLYV